MIKEAEENSRFDKSKKSLVNITYELDNLLLKIESFSEISKNLNTSDSTLYFFEILKELKLLYKENNFQKIYSVTLLELSDAYDFVILDILNQELQDQENPKSSSQNNNNKNVIDVELGDDN
jgi:hypothetical protein